MGFVMVLYNSFNLKFLFFAKVSPVVLRFGDVYDFMMFVS